MVTDPQGAHELAPMQPNWRFPFDGWEKFYSRFAN